MKSYIKPSNFKVGAEFGVYIYIGVTIASLCIAPFVFTFAPYLILPFALLVSKPIAWIALGAVFIVAAGLTFSAAKPLFDMAKDSLHKRRTQEKGFVKLKTLDDKSSKVSQSSSLSSSDTSLNSQNSSRRNSETSLDSSNSSPEVSPSSRRRNSETSLDSSKSSSKSSKVSQSSGHSSSKPLFSSLVSSATNKLSNLFSKQDGDAALARQNLVNQTQAGKYTYWLQQHDIAHIARAVCRYSENTENDVFFCIPGNVNSLNEGLKEYKKKVEQEKLKVIFTSIINLGHHWVTLVVSYNPSDKKYMAYYCDSFGNGLQDAYGILENIQLANKITELQMEPITTEVSNLISKSEENPKDAKIKEQKESMKEALRCVREDRNELVDKQIDVYYIAAVLQATIEISDLRSSKAKQQNDGYNCGVFALLNAKEITDMLIEGKSHDEIIEKLNYKLTLEELKEIRTIFAKILENDAEWKQNQSSVLEDTCVSQVGEKKRS